MADADEALVRSAQGGDRDAFEERFESLVVACNDRNVSGLACHQQNSQFC